MSTTQHTVAAAEDFPPGSRKIVSIRGREIGIFNIDGELLALRNVCPHRGAPLCKGRLGRVVNSTGVGDVAFAEKIELLKCPWHLWEFDLRTGRSAHDERLRVPIYDVQQVNDQIILFME